MKNVTILNLWSKALLLSFAIGLIFNNKINAQQLGGIPDRTFNVADSGGSVVALNKKNQVFYPGPNGGVFAANYEKYRISGTPKSKLQFFPDFYTKESVSNYFSTFVTEGSRSGQLVEASPGVYYKVGSWFSSNGSGGNPNSVYGFGVDSLLISKYTTQKSIPKLGNCFYFKKPLIGNYKTGIVQSTPTQLAFWLTYNPNDTVIGDQRHNQTFVKLLDTSGAPLAVSAIVPNFRTLISTVSQGKIYLLGSDEISPLTSRIKIVVLDAGTLQILSQSFPTLSPDIVISDDIQIFKVLSDGKILLAGYLWNGTFPGSQVLRLNVDGSIDNTYPSTFFSFLSSKWSIDAQGVIRCGNGQKIGEQNKVNLGTVQPNGGFQTVSYLIPTEYGSSNALMYHPDYNAFLFETKDIRPLRMSQEYTSGDIFSDTISSSRHRFYVGFNGNSWPLVNVGGVGMFGETIKQDVNPAINNKFLVYGDFTQVNKKLMPALAILKTDGQIDTSFKSTLHLPEDSLRYNILGGTHNAHLTTSGKVLISFPAYRAWNNYRGRMIFQDTLRRLLADGKPDLSYSKIWHHGTLTRGKNGNYYSVRFYENGTPAPVVSPGPGTAVKVLELNAEGDFIREFGSFTSNGSFPDSTETASIRYRDIYFVDESNGIWVMNTFTTSNSSFQRTFFIRFDQDGSSKMIYPNFSFYYSKPLKVEILPGKRMRWTGAFGLADTTLFGRIVNVLETDSTGKMDMGVTPTKFFVPDSYGTRYKLYAAPHRYLPDGKILTFLNHAQSSISLYLIRLQANGKQDNSFMPISGIVWQSDIEVIGDRLLLGVQNYNWAGWQYEPRISYIQNSFKNGLHAFNLKSTPANTGYVQGRVTQVVSPATGCNPTVPQKSTRGMIVNASPSNRIAFTDTGGYYVIPLEFGNHTVKQTIQNNFLQRQVCPVGASTGHSLNVASAGVASLGNDFINQTFDCPRLDLKVLDPRFRLCSRTRFTIQYANDGVAPQPNARIRVNLPEEIRILSASKPFIKDVDSSYVFDLGTLQPGQYGVITTDDTIACPAQPDSLARACFSARIEPLSLCSNIDPASILWDGSWLDAVARYNPATNKVRVVVYNKGASMTDSTRMRLTGPGLIYKEGKIKLAAGDSLVTLCDPAIQGSIQLQLSQPIACPLGSNSRLNHSGRGTARAFLNFGSGLLETYTVQACPVWRFSYDPNEKLVEPSGDVEPGTELDYTIHFENFGNDTAYFVAVVDSLPEQLDVKSLKLGASSHPFTLQTDGTEQNPILTFLFNPIKLTGKKQDSILSKGQVSFKIKMKDGVNRGEVISNRAHIYFDNNAAVITEFVHSPIAQLGTNTEVSSIQKTENKMVIAPNPARGSAKIWFTQSGSRSESKTIRILTMEGKLVKEMQAYGGQAEVKGLLSGIYLITAEGVKPQRLVVIQ